MDKQFPEANGLQDPILGQTLSFKVQKHKPFVQVLHDGKLHWIAISTYRCNEGEVCYIDSLFNGRITDHTKQQICASFNCDLKHVKINVLPVQQPSTGVDCGVFALAFYFYILWEKVNPVGLFFVESKFRHHLLHCLKDLISPFPKSTGQAMKCKTCKNREIMVEIFCTCRMPWRKAKNNIYAKQMVECSKCGEWFHRMCERIPEDIFMKQNKDRMFLQKLFKLKVKPQFSHHLIRKSEHCQSVRRTAENRNWQDFFFCVSFYLLGKWNLWNGYIYNSFI